MNRLDRFVNESKSIHKRSRPYKPVTLLGTLALKGVARMLASEKKMS
jgi:hypothetical protein